MSSLDIREVTLGSGDLCSYEDVTLWSLPNDRFWGLAGIEMSLESESSWDALEELIVESGMRWGEGPYHRAIQGAEDDLEDPRESIQDPEIENSLDMWRAQGKFGMDDLREPSFYLEWDLASGQSTWVGADEDKGVLKYIPDMLEQRDILNWMFNFHWNLPYEPWSRCRQVTAEKMIVPQISEIMLELVGVGENYGVAKSSYGAVFIPKSALNYLNENKCSSEIGKMFMGKITFTPDQKFPWRLMKNGVTFTYEDACGTLRPDDY
jgi:hypothetical protein